MRINFRVDKTPGRVLVELKDISKAFGDNIILSHTSAEIDRNDKIALIGANGKGKSTLLRIIAGTESFRGERKWGHNVEESFYAQHQLEALNLENTVLDEMRECGSQMTDLELRTLLGCFLFTGDDTDKKIRILSGGEKARVALAKTIVSKANFLMLDEPTNHLDIHSCELLIEALNKYEGSLILVSHDRYFISKTANKIWEIDNGKIREFKGGYEEWVLWKERMERNKKTAQEVTAIPEMPKPKEKKQSKAGSPSNTNQPPQPINKEQKKELQRLQKKFQDLENRIAEMQQLQATLESSLADPGTYSDKSKFVQTESAYKKVTDELSAANKEYEKLFETIISME